MADQPFDADDIHRRFITLAEAFSPPLAADIRAVGPIAWPKRSAGDIGRFLARAVVGQQLSTTVARVIWSRIEALPRVDRGDALAIFAPANAQALRACGVSGAKAKALAAIREAHVAGRLDDRILRAMPPGERTEHLRDIWGIGQWTCDMAAIFHFRDPDVWPEGDAAVARTFARYIGRRKPARTAARFAPRRSLLALYLWAIIDRMP